MNNIGDKWNWALSVVAIVITSGIASGLPFVRMDLPRSFWKYQAGLASLGGIILSSVIFLIALGIYSAWAKNAAPIKGWLLAMPLILPVQLASLLTGALLSAPFDLKNPYVLELVFPAVLLTLAVNRQPKHLEKVTFQ